MDIAWDRVVFELTVGRALATDTVRVFVQATLAVGGAASWASQEDAVRTTLATVLAGAWRFTNASRTEDDAGMERVRVVASVRVPERETNGLVERLRQANKPGVKLELLRINYRPAHALIDATLVELRRELYVAAEAEAKALNATLGLDTQPWRVMHVQVAEAEDPLRRGMAAISLQRTVPATSDEDPGASTSAVELRLKAKITVGRLSLPLEAYGGVAGK